MLTAAAHTVQVASTGDVVYALPQDFQVTLRARSWWLRTQPLLAQVWFFEIDVGLDTPTLTEDVLQLPLSCTTGNKLTETCTEFVRLP